ncbi:MAG: hypothetical protein ACO2ZM_07215 [Francisellaceae bacterium]
MNTLQKKELLWQLKTWKLIAILLPIMVALDLTANLIGHRMISVFGLSIYSGFVLRLITLLLLNLLRTCVRSSWPILIIVLFMILGNFIMIGYGNIINSLNTPDFFINTTAYHTVFIDAWHGMISNTIALFICVIIELIFFNFFYFRFRLPYFLASVIATSLVLLIGSIIVMYAGYVLDYPKHIHEIIKDQLISNFIGLAVLALLIQPLAYWIHQYYFD